jgi:hypothetical protein
MFFNGITPNQLDASDFAFFGASLVSGSATLDPAATGDSRAEAPALAFDDVLTPSSPADFSLHIGGNEGLLLA